MSKEHPTCAFAALTHAAEQDEYPEWAWRTFLRPDVRKEDDPEFAVHVAEVISSYPDEAVARFVRDVPDWLLSTSKQLATQSPEEFDKVISKLINITRSQPSENKTSIVRGNKKPDWAMEALNAPVGKIAQALFNDPRTEGLNADDGFPAEWIAYVENLLSLEGDLRRYAIVIFSHNLDWFHYIAPNWTESNLLTVLDGKDEDDRNAFWSGFCWGGKIPNAKLYMRIKPSLLTLAKERSLSRRGHVEALARIILAGWGSLNEEIGARFISNGEMRDVLLQTDDDFRSRILWQIERWSEVQEGDTGEKWSAMLLKLLKDVWPHQKSVKTPTMSARLFDLAFSNAKLFSKIAELILPLLTTIDQEHLMLPNLRKTKDNIVDQYPRETLALLHAVLPDNVAAWPYDMGETLQRISEASSSLNADARLIELKRKWNTR